MVVTTPVAISQFRPRVRKASRVGFGKWLAPHFHACVPPTPKRYSAACSLNERPWFLSDDQGVMVTAPAFSRRQASRAASLVAAP